MDRVIMHVDMNAFFASVEQQADPSLRGRPVLVTGDPEGRSVVSAASYEARPFGVRAGMPLATARRLCPGAVVVRARHGEYARVSRQILSILDGFSPLVEPFSIDEAFLDLTGCQVVSGPPVEAALCIKQRIRAATGLTCSIGIAPNRLLAKIASDLEKPDGLVCLRMDDVPRVMWPLKVDRLFGVGEKTAARLRALGIVTIGALARTPGVLLQERLGPGADRLVDLAWGRDHTPVAPGSAGAKSISHEVTLASDTADENTIQELVLDMCDRVARRARQAGVHGKTVEVKLRNSQFQTITRSRTLEAPTQLAEEMYAVCLELLEGHWDRRPLRLMGVGLSQLTAANRGQLPLQDHRERHRKLAAVSDAIRDRFGEKALVRARLVRGNQGEGDRA
ncbi:MAG: DNA polymerase IV [Bacillota bacterium]